MDPCSKYTSLCDIFSDDNSAQKKMKKNWYVPENGIENIPKHPMKTRKNGTSMNSRISNQKDPGIDSPISERTIRESTSFKPNTRPSKQENQQSYQTMSKNKPTNSSLNAISSASFTSSTSSGSSHNSTVLDRKNVKTASSNFDMCRLAAVINSAGRKLIKLAASMDADKLNECGFNFGGKEAEMKTNNRRQKYTNTQHDLKLHSNNSRVPVKEPRLIETSNAYSEIDRSNCCSSQRYPLNQHKPVSTQSRRNKTQKIQRLDDELNRIMSKNDSFNSIHLMDGHPIRQHCNEVHSSLERSITPSGVLNGLHPENCDTKNIRVTAYERVMNSHNRKKKNNKNSKKKKTNWKFEDVDFLDEDIF